MKRGLRSTLLQVLMEKSAVCQQVAQTSAPPQEATGNTRCCKECFRSSALFKQRHALCLTPHPRPVSPAASRMATHAYVMLMWTMHQHRWRPAQRHGCKSLAILHNRERIQVRCLPDCCFAAPSISKGLGFYIQRFASSRALTQSPPSTACFKGK